MIYWVLGLYILPMLFVWGVTIWEWKYTSMAYTKSVAITMMIGGAIPVFGLVVSVMYIWDKIIYILFLSEDDNASNT